MSTPLRDNASDAELRIIELLEEIRDMLAEQNAPFQIAMQMRMNRQLQREKEGQ